MLVLAFIAFAVAVFCTFMGLVIGIPAAWKALKHRRQRRRDPGAVVFERAVELLTTRACEWEMLKRDGILGKEVWLLKAAGLAVIRERERWVIGLGQDRIEVGAYRPEDVGSNVPAIKPSEGWAVKLLAAHKAMLAERAMVQQLDTISDTVEKLGDSNVIPMRRGNA